MIAHVEPFDVEDLAVPEATPGRSSDLLQPFVDREVGVAFRGLVEVRAIAAPGLLLLVMVVLAFEGAGWRAAAVSVVSVAAVAAARITARKLPVAGVSPAALPVNLVVMAFFQLTVVVLTGGLDSPVLPVLVPLAAYGSVLGGREAAPKLVAAQVVVVVALCVGHVAGTFDGLPIAPLWHGAPPRTALGYVLQALVVVALLGLSATIGAHLRQRIEHIIGRALAARGDELRAWETHSREVEALSGEIAHELKNPLASVKGLAALVARDLPAGRASERLAVLRAEVDRMTSILDEMLAWSRPLTPLTTGPVDLVRVAQHVVEMYEAVSRAKGVRLSVVGGPSTVFGDRRKLIQVLINLVQNALDASAAGGAVEVEVRDAGGEGVLEVRDRGVGLGEHDVARLMAPGVTTKEQGTGLGLAIAAAIVERHRGTLTLCARPGGGAMSRVVLPTSASAEVP